MGNAISNPQACISLGPWGGKGGVYSEYKCTDHVMQITIRHGDVIESILFESKRHDGVVIGSPIKIGGTGGSSSAKFSIDSSVEQFSNVSLSYKDYGGNVVLSSLCFDTNLKKYGPFGKGGGQSVSIPMEDGEITGFHGRGGRFVDAIGIFVTPKLKENEEELRNAYIDALIEQRTPEELKTKTEELNTKTKELKEREDVFQTKMEEVEAQKKELRERIKATQKLEEELKTKIEELKTKNKELTEREEVFQTKMEEVEARKNKEPILDMETWIPIPIFSPILY